VPETSSLPLDIALSSYGHLRPLKDGTVPIARVAPRFVGDENIVSAFRRMVREVAFDVAEMAPTTYFIARAAGAPYRALPVFVMRRFHHGGLVCRPDAGIRRPRDLEGKRVGVRAYTVTSGVWARGILAEEYGVDISNVTWVTDDEDHASWLRLPPNVEPAPAGDSLAAMLARGNIHAALAGPAGIGRAGPRTGNWEKGGANAEAYVELFEEPGRLEAEWFARTGVYPIHGLVVVKDELLDRYPWLAGALFETFRQAKEVYLAALRRNGPVTADDRIYLALSEVVGDPLPYGIDANRPAIEKLLDYSRAQGLIPPGMSVEALFVALEAAG
jgi:4,5-dihydroxyphthalate decarboxylase